MSSGINITPEKSSFYANLIEQTFDSRSVEDLLEGTLEVRAHVSDPYLRSARFITKRGGLEVELLPNGGDIRVQNSTQHNKGMSLVNAWIDGLSPESKLELKSYLAGEHEAVPPVLPKFRAVLLRNALERNMTVAHAKIGNVHTPLESNVSHLYRFNPVKLESCSLNLA